MTTENRNRHLVEEGVLGTNLTMRLNTNADLGWKVIQVVWTGAAYTVVWQRVEQVTIP